MDNVENLLSDYCFVFVICYICENLIQDFSVEFLVDKVCMSKFYFFKCFKYIFGVLLIEYVNLE